MSRMWMTLYLPVS